MPAEHEERRDRLARARLYLVCDRRPADFLRAALAGGVDLFQLRDKAASDDELLAAARDASRRCCDAAGALFLLNDRPDLAVAAGADGVHVGQDDMRACADARELVGEDARSSGSRRTRPAQIDAAAERRLHRASGPVHATPTKPGRPAVGLELVRHAAAHARVPWFAIGGIDADNVARRSPPARARVVVVRAIAEAADPRGGAREPLRGALDAAWAGGRRWAGVAASAARRGRAARRRSPRGAARRARRRSATRRCAQELEPLGAGRAPARRHRRRDRRRRCSPPPTSSLYVAGIEIDGERPAVGGIVCLRGAHARRWRRHVARALLGGARVPVRCSASLIVVLALAARPRLERARRAWSCSPSASPRQLAVLEAHPGDGADPDAGAAERARLASSRPIGSGRDGRLLRLHRDRLGSGRICRRDPGRPART